MSSEHLQPDVNKQWTDDTLAKVAAYDGGLPIDVHHDTNLINLELPVDLPAGGYRIVREVEDE